MATVLRPIRGGRRIPGGERTREPPESIPRHAEPRSGAMANHRRFLSRTRHRPCRGSIVDGSVFRGFPAVTARLCAIGPFGPQDSNGMVPLLLGTRCTRIIWTSITSGSASSPPTAEPTRIASSTHSPPSRPRPESRIPPRPSACYSTRRRSISLRNVSNLESLVRVSCGALIEVCLCIA